MSEIEVIVHGKEVDGEEKKPDKWEIDSWVRTVIEAEEIKKDPAKMKCVAPELAKKHKALMSLDKSLEGMKAKAADMPVEEHSY